MNKLGQESSPYLLQHKDNPIHWWAWGPEAFEAAKAQNKPVFLSVGYSTCHWCHVMAHESFEAEDVAEVLNKDFISIKVDREERPDVDEIYMKSLLAMTGGGGWPMSAFLTPRGIPFFAGTYFPKARFIPLLNRVTELWTDENDALLADGSKLLEAIRRDNEMSEEGHARAKAQDLGAFLNHFQYAYDEQFGGFGQAPKFPQSMNLRVMMRIDHDTDLFQAQGMVTNTLSQMSRGGMYDHLVGGFHRYSVDREWLVPHFEKMIYDQAMIVTSMLEASSSYKDAEFEPVIRETLDYVLREMTDADGGFYSGQDADSLDPAKNHKEEGFFATYSWDELKGTLTSDEIEFLVKAYGVGEAGSYEGRSILHLQEGFDRSALQDPLCKSAFTKLKKLRASKPAPHLDDKVIAGWNGWMISAFAQAARALNEPKYLKAAQKALGFVEKTLWQPASGKLAGKISGELKRYWRQGVVKAAATSEDYASVIAACMDLYQADFDPRWSKLALQLQSVLDKKFWDDEDGGYFTSNGEDQFLPLRLKDGHDGVYPSANSMAARNLNQLYALTGDRKLKERFEKLREVYAPIAMGAPGRLSHFNLAMIEADQGWKVAVLGKGSWPEEFYRESQKQFQPYTFWAKAGDAWPVTEGKDKADSLFVCLEGQCLKPAASKDEAMSQLHR